MGQKPSSMNGVAANAPSRAASASGLPPSARPARRRVATGVPAYSAARPRAPSASGACPPGDAPARGRRTEVRSVPGKAAFAGPDRQVPPARVGRPQVIGDLQRYGEVRRGEAAGGDGGGRVEQAEHPALPFGDVRVLLAQHPPERIGRADLRARRLGHRGVGRGHRPQRPGGRGRGRHYPLDEDLVVAVLPAVAEEAVRGQVGVAVLVRVPAGTGQPAAHGGLVEGDRAAVAGVPVGAADDLEHLGGVVRARAPDPGRGAGAPAGPSPTAPGWAAPPRAGARRSPSRATGRSSSSPGRGPTAGSRVRP